MMPGGPPRGAAEISWGGLETNGEGRTHRLCRSNGIVGAAGLHGPQSSTGPGGSDAAGPAGGGNRHGSDHGASGDGLATAGERPSDVIRRGAGERPRTWASPRHREARVGNGEREGDGYRRRALRQCGAANKECQQRKSEIEPTHGSSFYYGIAKAYASPTRNSSMMTATRRISLTPHPSVAATPAHAPRQASPSTTPMRRVVTRPKSRGAPGLYRSTQPDSPMPTTHGRPPWRRNPLSLRSMALLQTCQCPFGRVGYQDTRHLEPDCTSDQQWPHES